PRVDSCAYQKTGSHPRVEPEGRHFRDKRWRLPRLRRAGMVRPKATWAPTARSGSSPGIPPPEPISVTTASGIPAPERVGAIAGPGPFSLRDDAIEARAKRTRAHPDRIGMRSRVFGFAHVLLGKPVPTFPGHALRISPDTALQRLE